eukprot:TRINITY_DN7821_c0_g1_i2.p1 TRINITY_DN7821_c0_g1~~TRINITY_DN7821_c0_g1_i2.p1  ORF type:complete len:416 (+),score=124.61 TRINITY_DN7821_c0_g1_i2:30-1277(+)
MSLQVSLAIEGYDEVVVEVSANETLQDLRGKAAEVVTDIDASCLEMEHEGEVLDDMSRPIHQTNLVDGDVVVVRSSKAMAARKLEVLNIRGMPNLVDFRFRLLNPYGRVITYDGKTDYMRCFLMVDPEFARKVEDVNRQKVTALYEACRVGHVAIAKMLIEHGADVFYNDFHAATCLHVAAREGTPETISLIHSHGLEVDQRARDGQTAAHWAARDGRTENIQRLLDLGAHIDLADSYDKGPLHYAVFYGHVETATLLIEHGADVNRRSNLGQSPLHEGSYRGKRDCVKLLLDHGARDEPDINGTNAKTHALDNRSKDITNMIMDYEKRRAAEQQQEEEQAADPPDTPEEPTPVPTPTPAPAPTHVPVPPPTVVPEEPRDDHTWLHTAIFTTFGVAGVLLVLYKRRSIGRFISRQ